MSERNSTDKQIRHAVREHLDRDLAVDAEDISVKVTGGVVVLNGLVSGMARHHAAEEAAIHNPGVRAVVDETEVRPEASEAEDMAAARSALSILDDCPEWVRNRRVVVVCDGKVRVEDVTPPARATSSGTHEDVIVYPTPAD
jgi:hypothetical protein